MKEKDILLNDLLRSSAISNQAVEFQTETSPVASLNLHLPNGEEEYLNDLSSFSQVYHLTAKFLVVEMTRRDVSLLLGMLNYLSCRDGVNLPMYLAMDFLVNYLAKKSDPLLIKDELERLTVMSTLSILSDLKGQELRLVDQSYLKPSTVEELQSLGLIMSTRAFGSRIVRWRPDRFLKISAVPVDDILKRNSGTKRYDSYTKGYGEGSGSAGKCQKLKFSPETDGAEERMPEFSLKFAQQYQYLVWQEVKRKI